MQDDSFTESDRGTYSKHRVDDANTIRTRDGTSATKDQERHFGYRAHTLANENDHWEIVSYTFQFA